MGHGELPHAVLNLERQTALSECKALLRLSVVERRSLDGAKESRAVALREVLLELLPKDLDHPYCSALRALAGREPGGGAGSDANWSQEQRSVRSTTLSPQGRFAAGSGRIAGPGSSTGWSNER